MEKYVCKICNKEIKKSSRGRQPRICSAECRRKRNLQWARKRYASSNLEQHINQKRKKWKNKISLEYCLNLYKTSKGYCHWCGVETILCGVNDRDGTFEDCGPYNPDVFSFDAVIASAGHTYGNLVISCALCNTMKHAMGLLMWLIIFKIKFYCLK